MLIPYCRGAAAGISDGDGTIRRCQDDLMATRRCRVRRVTRSTIGCRTCSERPASTFVEQTCKPYYATKIGAPSLPPGLYFRMRMTGYFEEIDSERGIAWRCADSFSLRDFLRLSNREGS